MSDELSYEELLQEFDEIVQEYMIDNDFSSTHAKVAAYDDYENDMRNSDLVKAVITMRFSEHVLEEPYILQASLDYVNKQFNSIDYAALKLYLTEQQYQDLIFRTQIVREKINKHPITPNNTARWFYHQLTELVKNYYNNLPKSQMNTDEISREIIYKFRAARFSSGENVNLYTTLVECLLDDNILDEDILNNSKIILEEFDSKLLGDFFTKEEENQLNKRIQNVLRKLDKLSI